MGTGEFLPTDQECTNFGVHYMLEGYGGDKSLLSDLSLLTDILNDIPMKMGMHPISKPLVLSVGPQNKKDPGGVSGFVLIAESHISFHTFPLRGFVTIDVYTCQDEIDAEHLTKLFIEAFQLTNHEERVIPRGLRYPAENIYEQ
jgi:S-adenosylmethionine decarboxylase